jgi:uncharacterized cupin superfamily protein
MLRVVNIVMKQAKESEIPWVERRSPKGRFQIFRRNITQALGATPDAGLPGGGHPFDVELSRMPPGATNFPMHSHAAQWEMYIIRSGSGEIRVNDSTIPLGAGDIFMCPPGDAHQLKNTGTEDLLYYVIADNPPADIAYYPDSGKWFFKPPRKCFKMEEIDYHSGEEP